MEIGQIAPTSEQCKAVFYLPDHVGFGFTMFRCELQMQHGEEGHVAHGKVDGKGYRVTWD